MITVEQEIAWKDNLVTKELYKQLENVRQMMFDKIGNCSRVYKPESMSVEMARDAGIIEAVNIILTAQFATKEEKREESNETSHFDL